MSSTVLKIAELLGNFVAKLPKDANIWSRVPFRLGSYTRRRWHQEPALLADAVDDSAWSKACSQADIDTLDLSDIDQQLLGDHQPEPANKIASAHSPAAVDWQIVGLVRTIEHRIQELESVRHGTSLRRSGS